MDTYFSEVCFLRALAIERWLFKADPGVRTRWLVERDWWLNRAIEYLADNHDKEFV